MTSILSRTYQPYLLQHYRLTQWSHQLLATTLAALLMAISANISIPLHPVPLSLQSLAVLLLGAFLGRKLAYLYGFIFSAYIAGWAAERGYDRHFFSGLCAFALAHQIIFVFGVFYLAFYLHTSIYHALQLGYLPFAGFDLLKFFIATAIMFTLWQFGKKPS